MHRLQRQTARSILLFGAILTCSWSTLTAAQGIETNSAIGTSEPTNSTGANNWKTKFRLMGDVHYDDNIFLFSEGQKAAFTGAGAAEEISGRYKGMQSVTDLFVIPSFELSMEGDGLGDRKLSLDVRARYNAYRQNTERSHAEFDVTVEQITSRNGRASFRFGYIPNHFQKNYLADAIDTNRDGSISASERVYNRGAYATSEVFAEYRHRLRQGEAVDVATWAGIGHTTRSYDAPFQSRDRSAPEARAGLDLEGKRWEIGFSASLAAVDSPRFAEVLLLDEPSLLRDFNGDGDMADDNVRSAQQVDRTHTDRRFEVKAKFTLSKTADVETGYERRHRTFSSHEPFDVTHNGRRDDRDTFKTELTFRLMRRTDMRVSYLYAAQGTTRPGDPGGLGETTDYRRNSLQVGLGYRF